MSPRTIRPFGEHAVLVECAPDEVVGLDRAIRSAAAEGRLAGIGEVVPGERTLLVRCDGPLPADLPALLGSLDPVVVERIAEPDAEIPVVYDGPDLDGIARLSGLGPGEVIRRHVTARYEVAFCGFAPGFAYLRGVDPRLDLPRRSEPRARVPAGSVALAAGFTAVYPGATPGGWHLLGRTDPALVDPTLPGAVPLRPGRGVRFTAVDRLPETPQLAATGEPDLADPAIEVIDPGPQALLQDGGRLGFGHLAIGRAGPFDRAAHALVNRLVGNGVGAPTIEALAGGLTLRALRPLTIAVAGAAGPLSIDGRPVDRRSPLSLAPGAVLALGRPAVGLRSYLAVRGGLAVEPVLGSTATDTLGGLGPRPLIAGSLLALGDASGEAPNVDHVPGRERDIPIFDVLAGPRRDWFPDMAWDRLLSQEWTVAEADRIGLRLAGEPLRRTPGAQDRELPPEGMVPGAIQVPPGGQPVILGPDHPVTGGYPVIAVISDRALDGLAHLAPGASIRLRC